MLMNVLPYPADIKMNAEMIEILTKWKEDSTRNFHGMREFLKYKRTQILGLFLLYYFSSGLSNTQTYQAI